MGDNVKIGILETNGVEEEEICERALTADIVGLSPLVGGYDNVQDWIENNPGSTDHHSGWRCIAMGEQVTISASKESRSKGWHQNFGTLYNCGTFIID